MLFHVHVYTPEELNPPSHKETKIMTVPPKLSLGNTKGSSGLVLLFFTGLKHTFNSYS